MRTRPSRRDTAQRPHTPMGRRRLTDGIETVAEDAVRQGALDARHAGVPRTAPARIQPGGTVTAVDMNADTIATARLGGSPTGTALDRRACCRRRRAAVPGAGSTWRTVEQAGTVG